MITFEDVQTAAGRLSGQIENTPFLPSQTLSELTGAQVWLKFENLQFTGSFKQRGALNKLLCLSAEERSRGVIAVSAGNHAQGVAYHAAQLGIPATVVMPLTTPAVKANRTRAFGARVILSGETFQDAVDLVPALIKAQGLTLVHPYDDPHVIAGQGTVGLEMITAQPQLDALLIAVGGGGLISGCAVAVKHTRPDIEIVGVQSELYASMAQVTGRGPPGVRGGASIAEGIAVREPGWLTREYVRRWVDDFVVVREQRIEEAVALLLQIEKTLCEGAGAAGLAALLSSPGRFEGKRVGLILSGGNIDNRLLVAILQRQLVREGRLLHVRVVLPDQAGSLGRACSEIGQLGGNINAVLHDRTYVPIDAKSARVEFEIEVTEAPVGERILARLNELALSAEMIGQ
jgi:threonine dehydratase